MRKLVFLGAGSLLLCLGAAAVVSRTTAQQPATPARPDSVMAVQLAAGDTAALKGPRQPIFFRHDIHAGQYKIPCQYCHYTVAVSSEPGIPSVQTCMGCHLVIGGADSSSKAEIKKVREAWNNKQPMEWVRIHVLARHAHFAHSRHIKVLGPAACGTCHGDVTRMPQVYKVNNINNMGFCITCHLERQVNRDCSACHY
jgi:hypothetical protein